MWTAAALIVGLIAVVIAQGCAFFVMARRSEAMAQFRDERVLTVIALQHPQDSHAHKDAASQATNAYTEGQIVSAIQISGG
jgi:hypothetical protein